MFYNFISTVLTSDSTTAAPIGIDAQPQPSPGTISNTNVISMPAPGLISTLLIEGDTPALTNTESYAIEKNGTVTAVVAHTVISNATAQDLVHSVAVVKGDLIGLKHSVTGDANFSVIAGSFVLIPT